jgi:hypothetical protein
MQASQTHLLQQVGLYHMMAVGSHQSGPSLASVKITLQNEHESGVPVAARLIHLSHSSVAPRMRVTAFSIPEVPMPTASQSSRADETHAIFMLNLRRREVSCSCKRSIEISKLHKCNVLSVMIRFVILFQKRIRHVSQKKADLSFMPPFEILPRPKGSGGLKPDRQEQLIAERKHILATWATLFVQTAGIPRIRDLDYPAQQSREESGNTKLVRGVYLFHALAGTKARLVGGLRPMSHCQGALACKLAGQCWFNASCMGSLEHVFDHHESAIAAHEALTIIAVGPGAANNYYAKVAGIDTPPDRPLPIAPP